MAARLSDWISPLLHTPGYQPTAIGIRVAHPLVSLLTAVADPDGLRALTRDVRIRPRVPGR